MSIIQERTAAATEDEAEEDEADESESSGVDGVTDLFESLDLDSVSELDFLADDAEVDENPSFRSLLKLWI
jgi:hypothetical protein